MKEKTKRPLTLDEALREENTRLQDEIVTFKAQNISLRNRIAALEKRLANSTDVTFRKILGEIDGSKHEKI